jgi:hypothetical protein
LARVRKAARSRGGQARHGRRIGTTGQAEPVAITSVDGVIKLLAQEIRNVLTLEKSISRARAVGYLASVALKSFDLGEYDARLTAVERAISEQNRYLGR